MGSLGRVAGCSMAIAGPGVLWWWLSPVSQLGVVQWLGAVGCEALIKFALSPVLRLARLEWVSPQGNLWVQCTVIRFHSKCLCTHIPPEALCFCWRTREENRACHLPHFQTCHPTHSEISMDRSLSHLPWVLCKLPCFICLCAGCCLLKGSHPALTPHPIGT